MVRLDFNALSAAFNAWAMESLGKDLKGQLAPDSKSIKASLSDYDKSYQDFVSVVSLFSVEQGQVAALSPMRNKQTSKVTVVQHCYVERDHSHGRDITRTVSILPPPAELVVPHKRLCIDHPEQDFGTVRVIYGRQPSSAERLAPSAALGRSFNLYSSWWTSASGQRQPLVPPPIG
ncbi:MAG: hypothetical protein ACFB5Z_07035 [Elainellaceae cyanobacterium]